MSGFTEQEAYELLAGYPEGTQEGVLTSLGFPKGTEVYPEDIVTKAEAVYESMGVAIKTQKQLAQSMGQENQDTQLVVQQTSAIATEIMEAQGISLLPEDILILAQASVQEGRDVARLITNGRKAGYIAELKAGNAEFLQGVMTTMNGGSSVVEQVAENIEVLVDAAVPQVATPNLKGFLAAMDEKQQANKRLHAANSQQRASLPRPKVDVKAFLAARP